MRRPSKQAMGVQNGRVQKKNNWALTPNYWSHAMPFPVIDRERAGAGYRHLLLQRDIEKFIGLLPEWSEMSKGLNAILLARGRWSADGWYGPGVVAICAWNADLWMEYTPQHFEDHRTIFERLNVPSECKSDEDGKWFECRWTEETARAYQLLHIFLHEMGHHHDRMTTRSKKNIARGEPFAEAYALQHEALIWDRYTRAFKL